MVNSGLIFIADKHIKFRQIHNKVELYFYAINVLTGRLGPFHNHCVCPNIAHFRRPGAQFYYFK